MMPVGNTKSELSKANSHIRTVLGDIKPSALSGAVNAHDHILMCGEFIRTKFPQFYRDNVRAVARDLNHFHNSGGSLIVDCTPPGAGRDASRLATLAAESTAHVVCATGVHLPIYYPDNYPLLSMNRDSLAEYFIREISDGVLRDGEGPSLRAGVIKVASGADRLSSFEVELFMAAAIAQNETGCPIITHTEAGPECFEQVGLLLDNGAVPSKVVLSHCDRNSDIAFHRALLQSGVILEYDQHFRQLRNDTTCVSISLLQALASEFPSQFVVGMDLARNSYWPHAGGKPGMEWLTRGLVHKLQECGLSEAEIGRITRDNALAAFSLTQASNRMELV